MWQSVNGEKKNAYISDMQLLAIYHINHNRQFEFTLHSQEIGIVIIWKPAKSPEENIRTTKNGITLYDNLSLEARSRRNSTAIRIIEGLIS